MSKNLLVIGGSGILGKQIILTFNESKAVWSTFNLDYRKNDKAKFNIELGKNSSLKDIKSNLSKKATRFDCIINVGGGWEGTSIKDDEIIESSKRMMDSNYYSALMAAALANAFLNNNSLLVLTGASTIKKTTNTSFMLSYHMAKQSVHHLTEYLVHNSSAMLPSNTKVITLLPSVIDTPNNRKAMPLSNFDEWTKPIVIAELLKKWAVERNYPADFFYEV